MPVLVEGTSSAHPSLMEMEEFRDLECSAFLNPDSFD
jgi:hypothetical protein